MDLYAIFMYIIYFFTFFLIFRAVQQAFFTPIFTLNDYLTRSKHFLNYFRNKTAAINVLKKGLIDERLTVNEKKYLKLKIGILYNNKKDYVNAKLYFEEILDYFKNEKIDFDRELAAIVVTYYNLGEKEKARKIYHWLIAKTKYEPRFELFSYLDTYIFK